MGNHKKQLRSEKAKVKLRTKKEKDKLLPKGLNITNVTFKSKKINIQEQLKSADESQILSRRKLDVKALLKRLEHHNTKHRQESLKELKEILTIHSAETVISPLQPLLRGILSLTLDAEKTIRREALKIIKLILSQIKAENFIYANVIVPYLSCTMTHINPAVREDSLLLLDTINESCSSVIIEYQSKIIPQLMDLISQLHTDSSRRLLTSNLSSRMTTVRWTTKILLSLVKTFDVIVSSTSKQEKHEKSQNEIFVDDSKNQFYQPIFVNRNLIAPCFIKFNNETSENAEEYSQGILKHVDDLLPLIFESWVEVSTKDNFNRNNLTDDEVELLHSIVLVFQSVISYIDTLEANSKTEKLKIKFHSLFVRRIFESFPYSKQVRTEKTGRKKRQEDFVTNLVDGCDEENLVLCLVYVWLTKKRVARCDFDSNNQIIATKMISYMSDKLKSYTRLESKAQKQLTKVLDILFLEASDIYYQNDLPLNNILQTALEIYLESFNQEVKQMIFNLFESIAMDHTLLQLHSDKSFEKFVQNLLPQLLNRSINQRTIELLNNIVLRQLQWVKPFLLKNKDAILENAKIIEVEESNNLHESRLMICNLFYCIDGNVYF